MPCFQAHQPTLPSSSPPGSESMFVTCHHGMSLAHFQAHQPTPTSSSPPASKSSFVMCCVSKLTNLLLPLPPLQEVSANASVQSSQSCGSELLSPHITVHMLPIVGDHKRDVQVHLFLSFTFSLVKHVISDRFLCMG